jgi:homoserine kinase
VAAILNHDWKTAGKMMKRDLFHHPYRTRLIPELAQILEEQDRFSAYGAALSGAGPSIMWFTAPGHGEQLMDDLARSYPQYSLEQLEPEPNGVRINSSSIYV